MSTANRPQGSNRLLIAVNLTLAVALAWSVFGAKAPIDASAWAELADEEALGIPNAGAQRQKMIEELRLLRQSVDAINKSINSGKLKIEVSNIDKIKVEAPKDASKQASKEPTSKEAIAAVDESFHRGNEGDASTAK